MRFEPCNLDCSTKLTISDNSKFPLHSRCIDPKVLGVLKILLGMLRPGYQPNLDNVDDDIAVVLQLVYNDNEFRGVSNRMDR